MNEGWARLQEDAERALVASGLGGSTEAEGDTPAPASTLVPPSRLDNQTHIITRTTGDQGRLIGPSCVC